MRFLRSLNSIEGGISIGSQGFKIVFRPPEEEESDPTRGRVRELGRALEETEYKLDKILNNGIDFGDNVDGGFVEVTTNGGEQEVQHGLGHVPIGFFVILKDGAGDVYSTRVKEWTKDSLFLRSSAPNLMVRLFVL